MATPKLIFGAGGIGAGRISHTWTTAHQTSTLLESLQALGLTQLDSAGSYPPGAPWVTETLLGESKAAEKGFVIDSKVVVSTLEGGRPGSGHLTTENIKASLEKTLKLLGTERVHLYHCHAPDPITPLQETARGFDEQFRAGKFEKLGLSNYSTPLLEEYLSICEKFGYVKPSVIQGDYSAISRSYEESLFPLLRKHGINFNAFSPLAGGFLTGKVTILRPGVDLSKTRWRENRHPIFPQMYDRPEVHTVMNEFMQICERNGMTSTEASLRWIMHHSALSEGDGVILGATRIDQLESSVNICKNGALPEEVLRAVEDLWEKTRGLMENFTYEPGSHK